ncbi:AraC family transcriptional regulator [Adhaeribacter arboris]|uniref:AraC family transcriptional regulator n=1 Tax=Adhaeribacter arboris TaxID=2072846 RepID=A0A2T2YLV3_9BACT|nr:AraC family transcriptional regulator [Adhaeribacter arboris]PSR56491.1 AraC family transcriptional regulator [Adhaeribacter arboris]
MVFEFTATPEFDFLRAFAENLQVPVQNNALQIPDFLGAGFIKKARLTEYLSLIQHRYKLKEDLIVKRISPAQPTDSVNILFNINQEADSPLTGIKEAAATKPNEFAIRITSPNLDSEMLLPRNKEIYFTVISISRLPLQQMLRIQNPNSVVKTILEKASAFLFYESITPEVEKTLKHLTDDQEQNELSFFYQKIKVEELIYFVFRRLLQRDTVRHSSIHKADVEKIFTVKKQVLLNLSQTPRLAELAEQAGLSQSKMTDLFKQVFGDSIYNYYQKARMEEASNRLKQGNAVSEVGYQLGFSNLSHFSRVFARQYGVNPKKYTYRNEANLSRLSI